MERESHIRLLDEIATTTRKTLYFVVFREFGEFKL
jgi:hypothetical protein